MIVSLIMPSYQQGRFIAQGIESVLTQVNCEVELLVFDNESKDQTLTILRRIGDRVEVFVEKDLGQAHAINKGLRRAKGDVLGFLNSDDKLLPGAIEKIVNRFMEEPKVDLLYGKAKYIDSGDEYLSDYKTESWNWDWFRGECFICQPAAFWSRRVFERIGFFDKRLQCSMDYDYWMRIHQAGGRIEMLDDFLACSRDYSTTKTRSLRGKVFIENFKISLLRVGRIHPYWIEHYLSYLKYERSQWWTALLPLDRSWRQRISNVVAFISPVWAKDLEIRENLDHNLI